MAGYAYHAKFKCLTYCRDKPYSRFKPGQTTLERDYYAVATTEKPDGARCLTNYKRFGSEYIGNVSQTVKVGDYQVPCKDANVMGKPQNLASFWKAAVPISNWERTQPRSHWSLILYL